MVKQKDAITPLIRIRIFLSKTQPLEIKPGDFSFKVITALNAGKQEKVKVVSVLFSGRPRIISDTIKESTLLLLGCLALREESPLSHQFSENIYSIMARA